MSTFNQWVLLIVALVPITYAVIKGKELTKRQFNALFGFSILILLFIETKGTINVNSSIDTLVTIGMWTITIGLSTYFVIKNDVKRLAMVLSIPLIVLAFRLIDLIFCKISL